MALDIGLIDDVEPVAVAEVIPAGVVGVVATAHSINIEALHQEDVFEHERGADRAPRVGVVLMAIHPFDLHGHAIDRKDPAFPLDLAKAKAGGGGLLYLPVFVFERDHHGVEIRGLSGPLLRALHGDRDLGRALLSGGERVEECLG